MTDTLDPRFAANLGGAVPQNIPSTSAVHPTTPRLVPGVELSVAPGALAGPYGAAVLVTDAQTRDAVLQRASALLKGCAEALKAAAEVDDTFGSSVSLHYVPGAPGNRVIIAPTGPISRDFDDARRFFEAASAGWLSKTRYSKQLDQAHDCGQECREQKLLARNLSFSFWTSRLLTENSRRRKKVTY